MRRNIIRSLSCLLILTILTGCNVNVAADGTGGSNSYIPHTVTEGSFPMYYKNISDKSDITLYFVDEIDIPYISLDDVLALLNRTNKDENLYELEYKDTDHAVITRKNTSFDADLDFAEDVITFFDYDAFLQIEGCPYIDVFEAENQDVIGALFKQRYSNDRYGRVMSFDLREYEIDMIKDGDGWYMPLQTFSDIFLSHYGVFSLFNNECLIIAEGSLDEDLSAEYYSASGDISEELAKFSYDELCFALDHFYGLKDIHDINSFDEYFFEVGIRKALMSTDPVKSDEALVKLINHGFDDLHSNYVAPSYSTDQEAFNEIYPEPGPWTSKFRKSIYSFERARDEAYPEGIPPYEEIGNTAYITFDKFVEPDPTIDYLSDPKEEELEDTIRLMQYACDRIQRKDSPIENVVMDLSNNTGGLADTAAYVIATFLGRGETNTIDTLTGAKTTIQYVIDTNRDGKFDDQDTLAEKGYNLYCLTSPVSFSCGNLVPNVFATSPYVTLIGQTSGGGSCSISSFSTARGSVINISGNYRLSLFKNGSFYDIDRGADPDIYIAKIADFYDRESLTRFVNEIY